MHAIAESSSGQAGPEASCRQRRWLGDQGVRESRCGAESSGRLQTGKWKETGLPTESRGRGSGIWLGAIFQCESNTKEFIYSHAKHLLVTYLEPDLTPTTVPALKELPI